MSVIQEIRQDLTEAKTLKLLSSSFIELSAIKVNKYKKSLLQNKSFFEDIKTLYQQVRESAVKEGMLENVEHNATISLALTSNKRFYGVQNKEIVRKFLTDLEKKPTDAIMIGLTGKTSLESAQDKKQIEVIVFENDMPTTKEMYSLLERVKTYEQVLLYHPTYKSLMEQQTQVTDITYTTNAGEKSTSESVYIFEPELKEILNFFETHVRFLLLRRSLLEVELARTSARLVSMIGSDQKADIRIQSKKQELTQAQKSITNARLLETIVGARRWSKV